MTQVTLKKSERLQGDLDYINLRNSFIPQAEAIASESAQNDEDWNIMFLKAMDELTKKALRKVK